MRHCNRPSLRWIGSGMVAVEAVEFSQSISGPDMEALAMSPGSEPIVSSPEGAASSDGGDWLSVRLYSTELVSGPGSSGWAPSDPDLFLACRLILVRASGSVFG